MTTEKAIRYWEKFRREIDLLGADCYWPRREQEKQREAADMAIAALRAKKELESNSKVVESNDPLTLDKLRGMDREPVYIVENTEYWSIVNGFDQKGAYLLSHGNPDDYGYFELYGKTWLAYRRKQEEVQK